MPLSTTCRPISSIQGFTLTAGQQSLYLKIPAGTELTVTIPTVGVLSAGTITVDYTQSSDDAVIASPSTAVWTNAALTFTASTVAPTKISQNCWLRFNCTSGTGQVSLDPSGIAAAQLGAPFAYGATAFVADPGVTPGPTQFNNGVLPVVRARSMFPAIKGKNRPVWCSIGNSISDQALMGYNVAFQTAYYSDVEHALAFAGQPFQAVQIGSSRITLPSGAHVVNGGYGWGGAASVSIAADLPNFFKLVSGTIDVFFINTMENDPQSFANGVPAIKAAYDSIVQQCLNAGASLIYWKQCLPNAGISVAGALAAYCSLIKYMEAKAKLIPQIRIVPTYDLWGDSSNTYPIPLNTGLFANYTDGTVHPRIGGMWLGQRIADIMAADGFVYANKLQIPANGDPGFLIGSSNMVGTGGTFSGGFTGTPATPPAGLTVSTNMTSPTNTANAIAYNGRPALQISVSAATQAANNNAFQISSGNVSTGWSVGDLCQLYFEAVVDPAVTVSGILAITVQLTCNGSATGSVFGQHSGTDAFDENYIPGKPFLWSTPRFTVPTGTTSLRLFVTAVTDTANAVALRINVLSLAIVNWNTSAS